MLRQLPAPRVLHDSASLLLLLYCCRYVAKPGDSSALPSSLFTKMPQKKHSTPLLLPSSLEERASLPSATRKQSFPSISEQSSGDDSNMKKWGSIEQLQESGFTNEMGKDPQWSLVERGM